MIFKWKMCYLQATNFSFVNNLGECQPTMRIIIIIIIIIITNLHTSWSTVLLEKLTGSQLVKKFPAFYGTRKFITAFTSARPLSLHYYYYYYY